MERMRIALGAVSFALLALAPAGCDRSLAADADGDTLTIGAYSVVREAFHEAILPAFAAAWKRETGRAVQFEESYSGSGAQSRAIESGFDADVAVLSLEGDVERLVKAGLVKKTWNAGPDKGMITRSLVVIGVRPGNPHEIKDWVDLSKPGVDVLYPDPKTSGGARWNINAIFGAGLLRNTRDGGKPDPEAARALLAAVQSRVVNLDASGRQSMATFQRGTGDAVVTYENELLLQRKMTGDAAPFVVPPATLMIEGPAAVVDASVDRHGSRKVAEQFLAFLRTEEAQRLLVAYGFRPLDRTLDPSPMPPEVFTMKDLGGWSKVNQDVYGPGGLWDSLFTGKTRGRGR